MDKQDNVLKLSRPLMVDGEELQELPYDFDKMTARDKLMVSTEMAAAGLPQTTVEDVDPAYQLVLFAKAVEVASGGKIAVPDVLRISAKDAQRGGSLVRGFFYL